MTEQRGRRALAPVADEYTGPTFAPATPAHIASIETAMRRDMVDGEARTRAVAAQLGYQLPSDCADPDLIQRDIAVNMRRTAEAMLQVGLGLLVLKEACQHGEFMARLEVLRFEPRVAQRYMQVARKLSNASTSTHLLKVIDSQSKLLELIVLDDEQLEELALTGQTGELALDDIATMSVKELRAAVRKARADADVKAAELRSTLEAKDKLIDRKNKERDAAVEELEAVKAGAPDKQKALALEREAVATAKVADAALAMLGYVGRFDQALADLLTLGTPAARAQAEQTTAYVFQRIAAIASERGMLVDFQEVVSPSWLPAADTQAGGHA